MMSQRRIKLERAKLDEIFVYRICIPMMMSGASFWGYAISNVSPIVISASPSEGPRDRPMLRFKRKIHKIVMAGLDQA
jgi:hypothetical protein